MIYVLIVFLLFYLIIALVVVTSASGIPVVSDSTSVSVNAFAVYIKKGIAVIIIAPRNLQRNRKLLVLEQLLSLLLVRIQLEASS